MIFDGATSSFAWQLTWMPDRCTRSIDAFTGPESSLSEGIVPSSRPTTRCCRLQFRRRLKRHPGREPDCWWGALSAGSASVHYPDSRAAPRYRIQRRSPIHLRKRLTYRHTQVVVVRPRFDVLSPDPKRIRGRLEIPSKSSHGRYRMQLDETSGALGRRSAAR